MHQRGARINVEYTEGGLVGAIHSSRGQSVRYEYVTLDGRTHLCAVHGDAGTRRYEHDAAGLIHRVVASTGTVEVTNYYDPAGRITEQDTEYGRRVTLPLPAERQLLTFRTKTPPTRTCGLVTSTHA